MARQKARITLELKEYDAYGVLAELMEHLIKDWKPCDWPSYPWSNQRLEDLGGELHSLCALTKALGMEALGRELEAEQARKG